MFSTKPPDNPKNDYNWQDRFPWVPQNVEFKVCEQHKAEFFAEYEPARTDMEGNCIICYPLPNDALGG